MAEAEKKVQEATHVSASFSRQRLKQQKNFQFYDRVK